MLRGARADSSPRGECSGPVRARKKGGVRLRRRLGKKGMTLVEAIVVAVILVITFAVAAPAMRNFYLRAKQTARNNVARSLFMASQNALTATLAQGGTAALLGLDGEAVDLSNIAPDPRPGEYPENYRRIVSLSAASGSAGSDTNNLIRLLDRYVNDKEALNGAILIEFNNVTGKMLSCFYSEERSSLGYGGGGGYNVNRRNPEDLTAGEVGYYGVEHTGLPPDLGQIDPVEIRLVDYVDPQDVTDPINGGAAYGLLTAECVLPANIDAATLGDCLFTLTLIPQAGAPETLTIATGTQFAADLQLAEIRNRSDLADAIARSFTVPGAGYSSKTCVAYTETRTTVAGAQEVLVVLLDCAQDPALSIRSNYPNIGDGFLTATFTATNGRTTVSAQSNAVHAFFGGKLLSSGGIVRCAIDSVRHLNNIRYAPGGNFEQRETVNVWSYDGEPFLFAPIYDETPQAQPGDPFTGEYHGKREKIMDLTVSGVLNAGLFAKTGDTAEIDGVYLGYTGGYSGVTPTGGGSDIKFINGAGTNGSAGGIAAINAGTITNCTVTGAINGSGAEAAGGVAGRNSGSIESSFVGANVTGGLAAGGVAGICSGEIRYCEVGTDSRKDTGGEPYLCPTGVPFFGARPDSQQYNYPTTSSNRPRNSAFVIRSEAEESMAGGIVGRFDRTAGRNTYIYRCVNAAEVQGGDHYEAAAGGIAGQISGAAKTDLILRECYNAGSVFGPVAGGVVGRLTGWIDICYNSGYVNVVEKVHRPDVYIPLSFHNLHWPNELGIDRTGGVVGHGFSASKAEDCYSCQYAGSPFGGAFGVMEGDVETCAFLGNILNRERSYCTKSSGDGDKVNTGLSRLNSPALRRALTFGQNETGVSVYHPNSTTGVGPYRYTFPYFRIDTSDCALGNDFHRTPYQLLYEDYGQIRLTPLPNSRIAMTFDLMMGAEADAFITVQIDDSFDAITFRLGSTLLSDLDGATSDNPVYVSGWDEITNTYRDFWGYSRGYGDTEDRKIMGFDREYTIILSWMEPETGYLPDQPYRVRAELTGNSYIDFQNRLTYDVSAWISRPGIVKIESVTHTQQGNPYETIDLCIALAVQHDNVDMHLEIDYVDSSKLDASITINYSDLNGNPSFNQIYGHSDKWIPFDGDSVKRFPVYIENGVIHFMLFSETDASGNLPAKPNGLLVNEPFKVYVEYNGEHYWTEEYTVTSP